MGRKRTQKTGIKTSVFTMLYSVLEPPVPPLPARETLSVGHNSALKSYKQEIGEFKFSDPPQVLVFKLPWAVWLDNYKQV